MCPTAHGFGARGREPSKKGAPARYARWCVLLTAAALALTPHALRSQEPTTRLEVSVVDSVTSRPIQSALILLDERRVGMTLADGLLRLADLPASAVRLEVRFMGHRTRVLQVMLVRGRTTRVLVALAPEPIPLPGVHAEAEVLPRSRDLREFYERTRRGGGRYITRADIDRQKPRRLGDLFRLIPGMTVHGTPFAERTLMGVSSTPVYTPDGRQQECPILYFLDGTPLEATRDGIAGLDIRPAEVEGIEIYERTAVVPARYRRNLKHCGVVLIWKRERL